MQRFERILFVNDTRVNSEPAFRRAVRLAVANGAQLTVIAVGKELPRTMDNLQKAFEKVNEDQLHELAEMARADGIEIKMRVPFGIAFIEVIKEVMQGGHDLVIKSAEGRGGLSGMLFGSVDLHLLRKCPCPVWIIKPSKRKHFARILAAVDPDPSEPENAELNKKILEFATSLAAREHSELHILHTWYFTYESSLRSGRFKVSQAEVDRMVKDTRKRHKLWLDDLLVQHDFQGVTVKVHLLKGDPGDLIPATARKKRVELIVMGTVARTGIPGFIIGNSAEKALNAVDCSVLAVKPGSFVTPVE
ncbi:MAG: universal stress protein [Gammaproteobacteria bacterium]|nr:universal stress protein [Gammaproteobacteria bacterium]NNJ95624.1 universal stress protein [Gammaproteobacteria bacterium]